MTYLLRVIFSKHHQIMVLGGSTDHHGTNFFEFPIQNQAYWQILSSIGLRENFEVFWSKPPKYDHFDFNRNFLIKGPNQLQIT